MPPIHTILVAVLPLLALYARNLDEMALGDFFQPACRAILIASLLCLTLLVVYRNVLKATIGTSAIVFALSSYGHVTDVVAPQLGLAVACAWSLLVSATLLALFRTRKPLRDTTKLLNAVAAFLLISPCWSIAAAYARAAQPGSHIGEHVPLVGVGHTKLSARIHGRATAKTACFPDVYYIILDAYGRADSLKVYYGLDNSTFVNALRSRGFYVADQARGNYDQTMLCLASSLNMTYLDGLARQAGPAGSIEACRSLLDDNRVAATLSRLGYEYVFIGSGIGHEVQTADVELNRQPVAPLSQIGPFGISTCSPLAFARPPQYDLHRASITGVFDGLERVCERPERKFVFAHVLAPHPPFVFGPNGEAVYYPDLGLSSLDGSSIVNPATRKSYMRGYSDQARYINQRTIHAIDTILARSKRPPIILVQGDHGSRMNLDWTSLEKTDVREPFSILSAYSVPDRVRRRLYPTISPVNSFRIVLSDVFGENLPLLPDRSYYSTGARPYEFTDVSARTAIAPAAAEHPAGPCPIRESMQAQAAMHRSRPGHAPSVLPTRR
ncbi:MAG TPA: hypothetical protein VKT77_06845 [Chthonomonadaceae bacterium]|nr:hypothetical protein [Chthonomonadaceae bacterium]